MRSGYFGARPEVIRFHGFIPERAVPVDMFPWTEHIETVVLMSRVENQP